MEKETLSLEARLREQAPADQERERLQARLDELNDALAVAFNHEDREGLHRIAIEGKSVLAQLKTLREP